MIYKADKEIMCYDQNNDQFKMLILKVTKNKDGILETIVTKNLDSFKKEITWSFSDFLKTFPKIYECVTNTEVFIMYTNWNNFKKEGIHQDTSFADKIRRDVLNTLKLRCTVTEGTGKLEDFDRNLLHRLFKNLEN